MLMSRVTFGIGSAALKSSLWAGTPIKTKFTKKVGNAYTEHFILYLLLIEDTFVS